MNCPKLYEEVNWERIAYYLDTCEETCKYYFTCDTVALLQDKLKELETKEG